MLYHQTYNAQPNLDQNNSFFSICTIAPRIITIITRMGHNYSHLPIFFKIKHIVFCEQEQGVEHKQKKLKFVYDLPNSYQSPKDYSSEKLSSLLIQRIFTNLFIIQGYILTQWIPIFIITITILQFTYQMSAKHIGRILFQARFFFIDHN